MSRRHEKRRGGAPPAAAGRRWALLAVSTGVFCVQLDSFGLVLALPEIGRDLHADAAGLPWVISAYLLATGALMLGAGRCGDLIGRRRVLVAGFAVFGSASLACAVAPTLPVLVAARSVQGAGAAMIMPVGLSLLTAAHPARLRGRAIGWALGAGGVATACGPFVGSALTASASWRALFWVNLPLTVLGALCASRADESRGSGVCRSIDLRGLAGVTGALALLCVAIDRGPRWPWPAVSAAVTVAAVLLVLVLVLRRRCSAAEPLVDLGLLRNGPFVAVTLAGAVANAATVTFLVVAPLDLQGRWGLPVGHAGTAFLAPAIAMAAAGPVAGRVPPTVAVRSLAACLCGGALALASLSRASSLPGYVALATVAGALLATANALTLITTQAVIRPERAGEASGVTKTTVTVAAGLWVGLTGSVIGPGGGPGAPGTSEAALLATALGALTAGALLAAWSRSSAAAPRLRTGGEPRGSGERSRARRERRWRPPGRVRTRTGRRP